MQRRIALLLLALVASCALPPALAPTPTDRGCGAWGVDCGHGLCCDEGSVCGAEHTSCPVGSCCYRGGDSMFGVRKAKSR